MKKSNFPFDELDKNVTVTEPAKNRMGSGVVDKQIFFCKKCKKCWQKARFRGIKCYDNGVEYYDDFPSINKKRKTCLNCK